MKKNKKLVNWISKNFKFLTLLLLVIGVSFSVYSVFARNVGKISDPIGNWPTADKGYIGHPDDATNRDPSIPINESIYSLLGSIHEKASEKSVPCGTCYDSESAKRHDATADGCCETRKVTSRQEYCKAPVDGNMIVMNASINNGYLLYFYHCYE